MESPSRRHVLKTGVFAWALGRTLEGLAQEAPRAEYVCPPCGCSRDAELFDKPGTCPACGMRLVEKGSAAATESHGGGGVRAAVLIFDGVQVIDFAAPYEVFGQAGYDVFTVAPETRPVTASMGLRVSPRYRFADAPPAQVVLVPGGDVGGVQADPQVLEWIRSQSRGATHVLSVCNGAFVFAAAGLLQGQSATTFYDLIEELRTQAPSTNVVSDRRFVDNGKIITTAGLSSGIDGALHVVSKVSGPGPAQMAALNMEYDWKPDGGYARASFADAPIRRLFGRGLVLDLPAPERAAVVSTRGDRTRWEVVWSLTTRREPEQVREGLASAIDARGSWTRVGGAAAGTGEGPAWTFPDSGGKAKGTLAVSLTGAAVRIALRVERSTL